jgi:hypothetical protein
MLEWLKALGPLVLGAAVLGAAVWFQKWQVLLAKQKLRHELYDRRMAIYVAFKDLLLALPEKGDDEIKAAHRKASIARLDAPFLLDNPKIQTYLEELCKRVTDDVIGNIMYFELMNEQLAAIRNDPQVVKELAERHSRLVTVKHDLPDHHLGELSKRFTEFLKLTDFWPHSNKR